MPFKVSDVVADHFARADGAATAVEKGAILEDLIEILLSRVAGVEVIARNHTTPDGADEIDASFENRKSPSGLYLVDAAIFAVECKNVRDVLGTLHVDRFISKVRRLGIRYGVLVAANGVSGSTDDRNRSHSLIVQAKSADGIWILVLTRTELERLTSIKGLVTLLNQKVLKLYLGEVSLVV